MGSKKSRLVLFLGSALLASACHFEPPPPPPEGLPAQGDARCQVLQRQEIARAQSVFSCRGALEPAGETLLAAFRASREGAYTLLRLGEGGAVLDSGDTGHTGPQIVLRPVEAGVLAVSWEETLRWSVHSPALDTVAPLQEVGLEHPAARFYDVAVRSVPAREGLEPGPDGEPSLAQRSQGGALVAAATGFGVELWLLSGRGELLQRSSALRHPEMPYCHKVELSPHPRGWRVHLRCNEAVPMAPVIKQHRAQVPDFDYGARTPAVSDLVVILGPSLLPLEVSMHPGQVLEPPRRYALRRTLDEALPHSRGERVRTLDAWRTGEQRATALVCAGPDDGAVALYSVSTRCEELGEVLKEPPASP